MGDVEILDIATLVKMGNDEAIAFGFKLLKPGTQGLFYFYRLLGIFLCLNGFNGLVGNIIGIQTGLDHLTEGI